MSKLVYEDARLDADLATLMAAVPVCKLGLGPFDHVAGGLIPGRLIVLAGLPGCAKTTLAGQIADDCAAKGVGVVFVTLELHPSQIVQKSIARIQGHPFKGTAADAMDPEAQAAVAQYRAKVAPHMMFLDHDVRLAELKDSVAQVKEAHGAALVVVDYLQILHLGREDLEGDERLAVKAAVTGLSSLAKGCGVPVLAISSINRSSYAKKSVGLDALGASSAVEYSADAILHLAVEGTGEEREENMRLSVRPMKLSSLKARFGPMCWEELQFDARAQTFLPAKG